jgi:tRNA (guanine-N7-)-methyltransferase
MLTLYLLITFLIYYISLPYTASAVMFGSKKWKDRLGLGKYPDPPQNKKVIWLHASSMGEVKVLSILAGQLSRLSSDISFCITVMTDTGYERAKSSIPQSHLVAYFPLDHYSAIKRFIDKVKPSAAVFIETEIWPNTINFLGSHRIPIFLANGRISEKAHRRYHWARNGMARIFRHYHSLMVQSEDDRNRFVSLGVDPKQIEIVGSLKFDAPMTVIAPQKKEQLRRTLPFADDARIFIAGSTREGEHEIILKVFRSLLWQQPNSALILVPRHLDKIDDICRIASELHLDCRLYSKSEPADGNLRVIVVDQVGILNDLYHISDIAFVGGTLVDIGGHNILEPVWAGIPALYGPSIYNVTDSSEYILSNGFGAMVSDGDDLLDKLNLFFTGKTSYNKKAPGSEKSSRASLTAQKILDGIGYDRKNLADHNRK